jgi:hypothetical protein
LDTLSQFNIEHFSKIFRWHILHQGVFYATLAETQFIAMKNVIVNELDTLLEFTNPSSLKKSIMEVYLSYLLKDKNQLPDDFESIASDFYFLSRFVQALEEERSSNINKKL